MLSAMGGSVSFWGLEDLDFYLARPGFLAFGQDHREDSVLEGGGDLLSGGVFGDAEASGEATVGAFHQVDFCVLGFFFPFAIPADGEDALLNSDLDGVLGDFREVRGDRVRGGVLGDVHLGHPRAAVMVSSRWILVKEPTGEGFEIAERMVRCQSAHNAVFLVFG
jgi:hypothetical protein